MINDKFGPKGKSFEAEFRKKVINAKLEALYSGQSGTGKTKLINLESLDPDAARSIIDSSKKQFYSALEPEKIPRKFTYVVAEFDEKGKIVKASRTIIFMEEKVESIVQLTEEASEFRRPDFLSQTYELGEEELAKLKTNAAISFKDIIKDFRTNGKKILSEYFEIKSIDLNTPLDVKGALKHVQKHIETYGSSLKTMLADFNLGVAENGLVNTVMKEFYHTSLTVAEKNPLINAAVYFSKEQHTAVFTLINKNGELTLAGKVAAEMIRGAGSIKKILKTNRTKVNPEFAAESGAKAEIKRSINFLREIETLIPKVLKFVK